MHIALSIWCVKHMKGKLLFQSLEESEFWAGAVNKLPGLLQNEHVCH